MMKPHSHRAPGAQGVRGIASWVVAGLLLGSAVAVGPADAAQDAGARAPVLTAVVGTVEVRAGGADIWQRVVQGHELQPGDSLRTGPLSKAEVTHPTGTIRLFGQTVLRVPTRANGDVRIVERVELLAGASLFDVVPARLQDLIVRASEGARALFEVVTPHIVAGVKGTRFAVVEAGRRSVVGVYSGSVEATDQARAAANTALLGAGRMAQYADGRLTGVASFEGGRGFEGWSDPNTNAVPGLQTAAAEPGAVPGSAVAKADAKTDAKTDKAAAKADKADAKGSAAAGSATGGSADAATTGAGTDTGKTKGKDK